MRGDLTSRVALVTGASRGIGRAIAEGLARAGATVCINYRQQHDRAKETLQSIETAGGHGFVHQADVSDRDQAAALIDAVVERTGRLDILVNNAGITREGLFLEMSDAEWTSVLGTNLDGVYLCARLAARQMLGHGWGRIVNVSSVLVSRAGSDRDRHEPALHRRRREEDPGVDPDAACRPTRGGRRPRRVPRVGRGELHHGPGHRRGRRPRLTRRYGRACTPTPRRSGHPRRCA